ncbi:hypothetical protein BC826DRAFT_906522, partial [Russula brevipes]
MAEHATQPGKLREAPTLSEAKLAHTSIQTLLRGESRGKGGGYYQLGVDPFVRNRLEGIQALLNFYINPDSVTSGRWGASASMASLALGRGKHCAQVLTQLARQYILDQEVLPINPYGAWCKGMLADEALADDIRLFLQSLGNEITADKLVTYLHDPQVCLTHGIEKKISHTTACRYLNNLDLRFTSPKKGQYFDGHERPDVVHYRDHIYLPKLFELQCRAWIFDNDGEHVLAPFPVAGQRVVIWYHDESIFYAHDRRRNTWYHKDCDAIPYRKGEGASLMVADFFSADFGWLQ